MGIETSKALLARRRKTTARIARLVADTQQGSAAGAARERRITQGLRLARRRLRALLAAQRSAAAVEVEIGVLLMRVEAEGLSRNEVFARVGLPRHVGRKYVAAARAAQDRLRAASSTDHAVALGALSTGSDRDRDGTHSGVITERKD